MKVPEIPYQITEIAHEIFNEIDADYLQNNPEVSWQNVPFVLLEFTENTAKIRFHWTPVERIRLDDRELSVHILPRVFPDTEYRVRIEGARDIGEEGFRIIKKRDNRVLAVTYPLQTEQRELLSEKMKEIHDLLMTSFEN